MSAVSAAEETPAWLIHVPETTSTVYIAETSTSTFHRFVREGGGFRLERQDYMSIGKGGDAKERAGDQRTPLGIYFVTDQLDTTRLHEKYGPLAFPLDYPNAWDRRQGRTGDGIWVHGVDRDGGERPPLDTDGCIALPNDRLLALADSFEPTVRARYPSPPTARIAIGIATRPRQATTRLADILRTSNGNFHGRSSVNLNSWHAQTVGKAGNVGWIMTQLVGVLQGGIDDSRISSHRRPSNSRPHQVDMVSSRCGV